MTEQIVYTIPQVQEIAKTGRTKLYEEINAGRLTVCKIGRKTVITADQLRDWLRRCEVEGPAPLARVINEGWRKPWAPPAKPEAPKAEPLHDAHVREYERVKGKRAAKVAK